MTPPSSMRGRIAIGAAPRKTTGVQSRRVAPNVRQLARTQANRWKTSRLGSCRRSRSHSPSRASRCAKSRNSSQRSPLKGDARRGRGERSPGPCTMARTSTIGDRPRSRRRGRHHGPWRPSVGEHAPIVDRVGHLIIALPRPPWPSPRAHARSWELPSAGDRVYTRSEASLTGISPADANDEFMPLRFALRCGSSRARQHLSPRADRRRPLGGDARVRVPAPYR